MKDVPCILCASDGASIFAENVAVCLQCLNEYRLVPWHPTGSVRPSATVLIQHARTCSEHTT